jgi:hypothetical protein
MSRTARPGRAVRVAALLLAAAALLAPAAVRPQTAAPAPDATASTAAVTAWPAEAARVASTVIHRREGPPPRAAAAADGLDVATSASYEMQPGSHRILVTVDVTAVNRLPDAADVRYYYAGVNLAVQNEATSIAAAEDGERVRATTSERDGFRLLAVSFASRLYSGGTARVHVTYALPSGAPRSASDVRVGAAYSTFVAWAFGDRGTVRVVVPAPFSVTTSSGAMVAGTGPDGSHVLTADAADATSWYAWIDARNDAALTARTLEAGSGVQVVVRAWPEDRVWEGRVASLLSSGIPALSRRIGLAWPISGPLDVSEVASALLEGYAGFYAPATHQITVSEDLDPLTVVHEASHVWFNAGLFTDRWITEGLADEYASRVLAAQGVKAGAPPAVRTSSSAAFPLATWGAPAPIRTGSEDAKEQWAYDASWTLLREIVNEVGEPGMARVFAAAAADTTAYPGSGAPERSRLPSDWRRFVDLAEELGGGSGIAQMIAPWALTPAQQALLAPRAAARAAYHALVAEDGPWAAPVVVRMALDGWDFTTARSTIARAASIAAVRDAISAGAAREGLAVPAALQHAYETAATADALDAAAAGEASVRVSLDAVAAADAAVAAPRDWLAALGLLGQDPAGSLATARRAWAAGDAAGAGAAAAAVSMQLEVASDAGRLRVVAIGAGLAALLLLALAASAVVRRRQDAVAAASPEPHEAPNGLGPYPILPPSATPGTPLEPPAPGADEGAQ